MSGPILSACFQIFQSIVQRVPKLGTKPQMEYLVYLKTYNILVFNILIIDLCIFFCEILRKKSLPVFELPMLYKKKCVYRKSTKSSKVLNIVWSYPGAL